MHLDSRTRFNELLNLKYHLTRRQYFWALLHFPHRLLNTFVSKYHKMQQNACFSSNSAFSGPNVLKKLSGKCRTAGKSSIFLHFVRFAHERIKGTIRKMQNCWKIKYFLAFCSRLCTYSERENATKREKACRLRAQDTGAPVREHSGKTEKARKMWKNALVP